MGWAELSNGQLLTAAENAGFDVLMTCDQNIPAQQNMAGRKIALVELPTNHWETLSRMVETISAALEGVNPGTLTRIPLQKVGSAKLLTRRKQRGPGIVKAPSAKVASPEDLSILKANLDLTEREKGEELARFAQGQFRDYIEEYDPEYLNLFPEDEDDYIDDYSGFPDSILTSFLQNFTGHYEIASDPTAPTFLTVEFVRDFNDEWLVHFTDHASEIAIEGFKYGVDDPRMLALTTNFSDSAKKRGGYNFAFAIEDLHHWDGNKYGKECVVFKATGIETYHYGDQEPQCIFWGADAHSIIPITRDNDTGDWALYDAHGDKLFESGDIREAVNWATENAAFYFESQKADASNRGKTSAAKKCNCGCAWAEHHHMADLGCKNEKNGCGCTGWDDGNGIDSKTGAGLDELEDGGKLSLEDALDEVEGDLDAVKRKRLSQRYPVKNMDGVYYIDLSKTGGKPKAAAKKTPTPTKVKDFSVLRFRTDADWEGNGGFTIWAEEPNPYSPLGFSQVGYITIETPEPGFIPDAEAQHKVYVFDVNAEPEWRGTGLGQKLYDMGIAEARKRGALFVYASEDQTPEAKAAWKRLEQRYVVKTDKSIGLRYLDLRTAKTAKVNCSCGHPASDHTHPPDFGCVHEKDGCGCKGLDTSSDQPPKKAAAKKKAPVQAVNATETPAFKAWFGHSKIVDGEGKPLVVHHGTDADFDTFDRAMTKSGPSKFGFWFARDKDFAELFGSKQMATYLKMERPYKITSGRWNAIRDAHAKDTSWFERWRDKLVKEGYDGLMVEGEKFTSSKGIQLDDPSVFAVFEPTQIKSVENTGSFDPENPVITARLLTRKAPFDSWVVFEPNQIKSAIGNNGITANLLVKSFLEATVHLPVFDASIGVDWADCPLVERVPGKVSGVPILKHSRLPADTVVGNFDAGCSAEEIADMFEIPIDTVQAVLDYAAQYRGLHANTSRPQPASPARQGSA